MISSLIKNDFILLIIMTSTLKNLNKVEQLVKISDIEPFTDNIAKELCREISNLIHDLCNYDSVTIETESDTIAEIVQILDEPKENIIKYVNILWSHYLEICINKQYAMAPASSWG